MEGRKTGKKRRGRYRKGNQSVASTNIEPEGDIQSQVGGGDGLGGWR